MIKRKFGAKYVASKKKKKTVMIRKNKTSTLSFGDY